MQASAGASRRGGLRAGAALVAAAALGALFPAPAAAQSAEESLRTLGAENARLYIHPVTAGLGAALNAGFFHTASVHRPLGFHVSVRAMGAFVPARDDTFTPILPSSVTFGGQTYEEPYAPSDGVLTSPTAVGEGQGMLAVPSGEFRQALIAQGEDPADYALRFPEGFDLPAVPFALAQVGVGLPAGTEVALRFTPSIRLGDDVGSVSMLGLGVKHSLDQWLPFDSPLRLAVSAGIQRLQVGESVELDARQASLVFGADVAILSLYGAAGWEDTSAEVEYVIDNQGANPGLPAGGTPIAFRDEGENGARGAMGLTVHLGPVKLNGEYVLSRYHVASATLLFGVR